MTTGLAPVVPFGRTRDLVLEGERPAMPSVTFGVSPLAPPLQCLSTFTVPVWRVLVIVQTTLSPVFTTKSDGANVAGLAPRTQVALDCAHPGVGFDSFTE